MDFDKYLECSKVVDYREKNVFNKAKEIAGTLKDKTEIAKECFLFVRDEIAHSGDFPSTCKTTIKASEVLKEKTGWCYSKSILLAALLRANNIPAGFSYQRLSCSEYVKDVYCLHGLNAIYLKDYGWYRVDSRGNKEGVNAQFTPPKEKLAFEVKTYEYDIDKIFAEPLKEVVIALEKNTTYEDMVKNFPDIDEKS